MMTPNLQDAQIVRPANRETLLRLLRLGGRVEGTGEAITFLTLCPDEGAHPIPARWTLVGLPSGRRVLLIAEDAAEDAAEGR